MDRQIDSDTPVNKSDLRKLYLEKRRQIAPDDAARFSSVIAASFFASLEIDRVKALHCFFSILRLNEIDTRPIFEKIWSEYPKIDTYAPRLSHDTDVLETVKISRDTTLIQNSWGIHEPVGIGVDPAILDVVLVPLVCFDQRGHRVGYGKGYYDRLLAVCRPDCKKIGLSFFPPVDAIADVHGSDVPLDRVITPNEIYRFG